MKKNSNYVNRRKLHLFYILATPFVIYASFHGLRTMKANATKILSPLPDPMFIQYTKVVEVDKPDFDFWVNKYSRKYLTSERDIEYTKFKIRCLYWKESRNELDNDHGDNGMAGGPLQFWHDTYVAYRNIMIQRGHVEEVGSRYDLENAIETTVWAISDGRGNAWGPLLRNECK